MAKNKKPQAAQIPEDTFEGMLEEESKQRLAERIETLGEAFNVDDLETEEVLETGAEFWDFDNNPELIGMFHSNVIAREDRNDRDGKKLWEKGDTIGYNMSLPTGDYAICPKNFSIAEHLGNAKPGEIYKIIFKGKDTQTSGRQFSRFNVIKMRSRKK